MVNVAGCVLFETKTCRILSWQALTMRLSHFHSRLIRATNSVSFVKSSVRRSRSHSFTRCQSSLSHPNVNDFAFFDIRGTRSFEWRLVPNISFAATSSLCRSVAQLGCYFVQAVSVKVTFTMGLRELSSTNACVSRFREY